MYFKRELSDSFKEYKKFPVVAVLGPRQSGKTTLVTHFFKKHVYLSLEDPELRELAQSDPKGFLEMHENAHGIILDEFQYVPQILSYIQLDVDQRKQPGYFVLTGSQNFLVNEKITQSLAGRIGILTLLPLSLQELVTSDLVKKRIDEVIIKGGYPRLYEQKITPSVFYRSYIQTYLQRDVQQLVNVGNLRVFQKFMALCAGRVGQLLNIEDIAVSSGINRETASRWLSMLEASYIIFLLKPHFNNFNKRLTKTPKLYFYDTGLACALLGIKSARELSVSSFRGALFENALITDFYKQYQNMGEEPRIYFWRDQNGRLEVDCLIDMGLKLVPIELKSGSTASLDYFDALKAWCALADLPIENSYVVYGGELKQKRTCGTLLGWQQAAHLMYDLEKSRL